MSQSDTPGAAGPDVRELRLAVVLYGGVSLAIYMHGASKELHRLVRGSGFVGGAAAGESGADEAEGHGTDAGSGATTTEPGQSAVTASRGLTASERVYRDLAGAKAAEDGVATRVVVDTIAGTSAGGINGVYLAKALAHDLSQDALRDLWFQRGDLEAIVRGPKQLPWKLRLPWVVATIWRKPALDGDPMSGWLFDALADMDRSPARGTASADAVGDSDRPSVHAPGPSLLPAGHELELFVTLTDFYGYPRRIPLDDPPVVAERRHRHVMAFRYGRGGDDFRPGAPHNAALAFAARATSSLPGGFPPVGFASFQAALRERSGVAVDLSALGELDRSQLFRAYALSGADVRAASFVDGGVLDNMPFGHALDAVQQKRAAVEVDRRLVYLDPDPTDVAARLRPEPPAPIAAALGALSGIPRSEPILDDLLALQRRNERVRRLRDVVELNWPAVAGAVADTLDAALTDPPTEPDDARVARWQERLRAQAVTTADFGQGLYVRAKVADAVDHWAHACCRLLRFPADSTHAAFVRAALGAWAARGGLFRNDTPEPSDDQVAFLRDLDLGYRVRRLRFVLAGLGWWYHPDHEPDFLVPARGEIDEASRLLSDAVDELRAVMDGHDLPAELTRQLEGCLHEEHLDEFVYAGDAGVAAFLDEKAAALTAFAAAFREYLRERVAGLGARVYRDLARLAGDWDPEARRRLTVRYVGFPVWDALLYPYEAVAGVGEQDHVEVTRLSPRDSRLIPPPEGGGKLVGARHHHLGAFFSRAGRENDYLWGRLDAAERLITVLLGADHRDHDTWCHRAFAAVLDEERGAVPHAAELVGHVRTHVDAGAVGQARE